MEVYVDDVITKHVNKVDPVNYSEETFEVLRYFSMKLNLKK